MRKTLAIAAFALAAIAAPASAQSDAADALEAIDDPNRVEAMASAIEDMTAALLGLPVGAVVEAVRTIDGDATAPVAPDATVGDLTRSDPDLPDRLGREARVTGTVAGQMARDIGVALPLLQSMASDIAAQWRQRIADARRNQP